MENHVEFVERNVHGAIVVYGDIGIRQYYGYSVSDAKRLYNAEASEKLFFNHSN